MYVGDGTCGSGPTYMHQLFSISNPLKCKPFLHPGIEICITFPCEFTKTQVCVITRNECIFRSLPSTVHSFFRVLPLLQQRTLITLPHLSLQCQLKEHYQLKDFTGPVDCVRYTLRTKGVSGLYKGLMPWLVFAFPRSAVRFSTYEYASHALQSGLDGNAGTKKLDPLLAMTAGTLAGASKY